MTSAERIERFLVGPLSEAGIIEGRRDGRGGGGGGRALSGPSAVLSAVLSFSSRLIPKQLHSDDCEREGSEFDLTAKSHVRRRRRPCNFRMFFSPSLAPSIAAVAVRRPT